MKSQLTKEWTKSRQANYQKVTKIWCVLEVLQPSKVQIEFKIKKLIFVYFSHDNFLFKKIIV